jgi:hypothetical protein
MAGCVPSELLERSVTTIEMRVAGQASVRSNGWYAPNRGGAVRIIAFMIDPSTVDVLLTPLTPA